MTSPCSAEFGDGLQTFRFQNGTLRSNVQCIQLFFSQILFDFKRMDSHSISPKFSGKIPYVLSKPRICFLGSKDKTVLFKQI